MNRGLTINEGGQDKRFAGVNKLEIDLQGGGTSLWVPKDERELESLSATENGTYRPAEKYGYSRASVHVSGTSGKIAGKGQDGNDYTVDVDSQTGELVKTKVPSSIAVTTLPTTLEYEDGDRISFVNIGVTAYDGEGNAFDITGYPGGAVPFAELQFPVTTAVYDGQGGGGEDSRVVPAGFSDIAQYDPIPTGTEFYVYPGAGTTQDKMEVWAPYSVLTGFQASASGVTVIYASATRPSYVQDQFTYDGKTVYLYVQSAAYGSGIHHIYGPDMGRGQFVNLGSAYLSKQRHIAWTLIYGEASGGSTQEIPVNWPRYNDGLILSASYDITVSPGETSGEDDGFTGHDGNF